MATGRLGVSSPAATTATNLFQVGAGKVATFSLSICNTNAASVTVRVGLCTTSATFGTGEYIEYDTVILGNSVMERTGLVLDATKYVVVYASTTGVNFVAYGFEE